MKKTSVLLLAVLVVPLAGCPGGGSSGSGASTAKAPPGDPAVWLGTTFKSGMSIDEVLAAGDGLVTACATPKKYARGIEGLAEITAYKLGSESFRVTFQFKEGALWRVLLNHSKWNGEALPSGSGNPEAEAAVSSLEALLTSSLGAPTEDVWLGEGYEVSITYSAPLGLVSVTYSPD